MRNRIISAVLAATAVLSIGSAASADTHTVRSGETLSEIAGPNWRSVAARNGISNPNVIHVGDVIHLDGGVQDSAPAHFAVAPSSGVWDRLAQCESGGNWSINTGNGYYGGLQFTQTSWHASGGSGSPQNASRSEQIRVAENLKSVQGWGAWPACSAKLGLR